MIDIQKTDHDERFKWCLVGYLYPVDKHPVRSRKLENNFARILDFKDLKFPLKIRDICEIEKSKLYQHQCFWLWE